MGSNGINPLILQNRLVSQARSRARSQGSGISGGMLSSSSDQTKNALLDAVKNKSGKGSSSEADLVSKTNYTAMKKAATSLAASAKKLLSWPEKKLEEMTEEEKNQYRTDVVSEMDTFISNYNAMIKSMTAEGGQVNEIYLKQLKSSFGICKSDLEALGITQGEDGTLSLNKETLGAADVEKIKKLLGSEGSFVDGAAGKTERIIANADTNLAVLNKSLYAGNYSYDQTGSDIFDMLASGSKYNFWS